MEAGENAVNNHHAHPDVRGWKMVPTAEFWQLFLLMGILTGIGLMTINNIGNDATALWQHYDDSVSPAFILQQQALHVSILSVCSFLGRLLSGVGSDFLVKKLHASRFWCLSIAAVIFFIAQICALQIENPAYLGFVSGFTGNFKEFLSTLQTTNTRFSRTRVWIPVRLLSVFSGRGIWRSWPQSKLGCHDFSAGPIWQCFQSILRNGL